jgi:hypothetical protein
MITYQKSKGGAMSQRDRRIGFRVPLEMFVTQCSNDRLFRALTMNVSETGVFMNLVSSAPLCRARRDVGLEFELPGTGEIIWARGQVRFDEAGSLVVGTGVRFTAMARAHARLLRDFCVEKRRQTLGALLARIRHPLAA